MCAARRRPTLGGMTGAPLSIVPRSSGARPRSASRPPASPRSSPATAAAARRGLTYRGITYDTGIDLLGGNTRVRWSRAQMEGEIDAIRNGLRCNAVSLAGTHIPRLVQTAEAALERGMHVMIQPRKYDRPQTEILDHLARTAEAAERLRKRYPGRVTLITGCEHPLFTPGIVPGEVPGGTFLDRIALLGKADGRLEGAAASGSTGFSGRAAAVGARQLRRRPDRTPPPSSSRSTGRRSTSSASTTTSSIAPRRARAGARPLRPLEQADPDQPSSGAARTWARRSGAATATTSSTGTRRGRSSIGKPVRSEATQARYLADDARRLRVARSARRVRLHVHLARRPQLGDAEVRPGHLRVLGRQGRPRERAGLRVEVPLEAEARVPRHRPATIARRPR